MTATVYFGISALMVLSAIAVPAIAILGGYSVLTAVDSAGGVAELQKIQPAEPLDFSVALAMVVGSFVSAGTLTATSFDLVKNRWARCSLLWLRSLLVTR